MIPGGPSLDSRGDPALVRRVGWAPEASRKLELAREFITDSSPDGGNFQVDRQSTWPSFNLGIMSTAKSGIDSEASPGREFAFHVISIEATKHRRLDVVTDFFQLASRIRRSKEFREAPARVNRGSLRRFPLRSDFSDPTQSSLLREFPRASGVSLVGSQPCPLSRLASRRRTPSRSSMLARTDGPGIRLSMPPQYIFTIENLSKAYGKKEVLKNIWLSFYPGAKIGVIGGNGSGKSTLLRIMAGLDNDFVGTARPAPGISIGYLPQEPTLDPSHGRPRQRRAGRRRTSAPCSTGSTRSTPGSARGPTPTRWTPARGAGRRSRTPSRPPTAGTSTAGSRSPWTPCGCRPATPRSRTLSGGERRRVALCKVLLERPDILLLDEPTNHLDAESVAWLERHLQEYPGHRRRRHPRPLLPRQRRRVDPRARPRPGHPLGGQLLLLARAEAGPAGPRGEAGEHPPQDTWPASWSGSGCRPGPASPRTGPGSSATSSSPPRRPTGATRPSCSRSRPGRTSATSSSRPRASPRATATGSCSRT